MGKVLWFKGFDFVRDVACCDDVAFEFNGTFDNSDMKSIWDERDDQIMFGDCVVEILCG